MNQLLVNLGVLAAGGAVGVGVCSYLGSSAEIVNPSVASGIVYEDTNGNGTQDEGESGIAGATVIVTVDQTTIRVLTSAEGTYRIEMPVTSFGVAVDESTLGFPAQLTTGRDSYSLNVPPDFTAPNINFGYQEVEPSSATGTVYQDTNGNGTQDDGEPGLPDVTVTATDNDTGQPTTLTTDDQGQWRLEIPGTTNHRIRIDTTTLPFPAQLTTGRDEYNLNIPPAFTAPNINFGYQPVDPGTVAGVVFEDVDGDGERDNDEPGLADVEVVLAAQDGSGTLVTVVTDTEGAWTHRGAVGMAVVSVDTTTLPSRDSRVPSQTTDPSTYALDVTAATDRRDVDFGFAWFLGTRGVGATQSLPTDPTDDPTPDDPSPEPSVTAQEECSLVGTWDLRDQAFFDEVARLGAGSGQSFDIQYVSGDYTITLREDGTYTGNRDSWSFRTSTPQGALVVTIDATDTGTWSTSGNELTIAEPGGEADVQFSIEQGGQLVPLPVAPSQNVGTEAISGTGTFTCEGDVFTVTFEGATSVLDRVS